MGLVGSWLEYPYFASDARQMNHSHDHQYAQADPAYGEEDYETEDEEEDYDEYGLSYMIVIPDRNR